MHEVVNQTIGQIRENSKFLSSQRTELEKFYKTLRKDVDDISDPEIVGQNEDKKENSTDKDDFILDNKKMNDLIKNAMISKEKYKEDKKNKK
jgi:esterase/lipase